MPHGSISSNFRVANIRLISNPNLKNENNLVFLYEFMHDGCNVAQGQPWLSQGTLDVLVYDSILFCMILLSQGFAHAAGPFVVGSLVCCCSILFFSMSLRVQARWLPAY